MSILERAFILMEDGDFVKADQCLETALNENPKNALAYVGKLMCYFRIPKREYLGGLRYPIDDNMFYKRALMYADDALKEELVAYSHQINNNIAQDRLRAEEAQKESIYISAFGLLKSNKNISGALAQFESIADYKDSRAQIEKCKEQIKKNEEEKRKKKVKTKRIIILSSVCTVVVAVVVVLWFTVFSPMIDYNNAKNLMIAGEYDEAVAAFDELGDYSDSKDKVKWCEFNIAKDMKNKEKYVEAAPIFRELGDYMGSNFWYEECLAAIRDSFGGSNTLSVGYFCTIGLKNDGTVITVGMSEFDKGEVEDWTNIVAVSARGSHTIGLKSDGSVVATYFSERGLENERDLIAISAGYSHLVGLKVDGAVVAVGDNKDGQCDVDFWRDIVAVSAGYGHTVGLKSDGTVIAVGDNEFGQCDVEDWTDIVAVSAGFLHTLGLKSDGTVVAAGSTVTGECDVENWTDIVAVSAGESFSIGLKSDGTVVSTGNNYEGRCDVEDWTDIVAISAGDFHTVGLKADGTVVAVGDNDDGQCDVDEWTDIKLPQTK